MSAKMMYIVMKSGHIYPTTAKDELSLHKLLNDQGPFLLIKDRGSINKYEISHTFRAGENPVIEKIANHPLREQEILRNIIKMKKAQGRSIKSYSYLMSAYNNLQKDGSVDTTGLATFAIDTRKTDLSLYTGDADNTTESD